MKKLFLSIAVVATLAAATSCSPSAAKAEDEGAAIKAKIENCSDPDSLRIYVQKAQDYAAKLVKKGDDKAAQAYLDEVAPVIEQKDPSAADVFKGLVNKADSAVTAAADSAAVKAQEKAEEVKDKAAEAASKTADKISDAANAGKEKAADAIQSAADKAKSALGK